MAIPVAVNGTSLLAPLAGVGQYTYHLMGEIEKHPEFEPWFFYGPVWNRRRLAPEALDARVGARRIARLRGLVRTYVPQSYALARYVQNRSFGRGARKHDIRLYHEPCAIPLRFDGPIVNTIHDLSILRFPETHPRARVKAYERQIEAAIAQSSVIITVSQFVAREIIKTFSVDESRVCAIHNGVSADFRPQSEPETRECLAKQGLAHGRYMLAVGTLEPRKNIISLVRAYRKLPSRARRRCPLAIVGAKGWRNSEAAQEMAPLVASGEIKLLGYVSDADLPKVYAGSAMLVYPSIYEGFGLPPLEAMACGVPVITSNRSSLPEVVGDAGILVEPHDIDALSAAMLRLMDDPEERKQRGRAGLERARQFSWAKCARETMAVYRRVLETG